MDINTLITATINPFPLAMTAGMLVDTGADKKTCKEFMDQVINQTHNQGVDIKSIIKEGDSNSSEPIPFSIPAGRLLTVAEYTNKAFDTQPKGAVTLMKAWLPFMLQVTEGVIKDRKAPDDERGYSLN